MENGNEIYGNGKCIDLKISDRDWNTRLQLLFKFYLVTLVASQAAALLAWSFSAAQQTLIIQLRLVGSIIIPHYILNACSALRHGDTRVHETFSGASSLTPSFFSCRVKYPSHESFKVEIISGDYEGDSSARVWWFFLLSAFVSSML